jgi:predicted dehydrogenase
MKCLPSTVFVFLPPVSIAAVRSSRQTMPKTSTDNAPLNRREFLGSSAMNAAGAMVGAVGLAGVATASTSSNEQVNVGVIGIRNQGKLLATELTRFPDVWIAAICDVDATLLPGFARTIAQEQGVEPRCEIDFRRLLDDQTLNAVVIATPDHWHAPLAILSCRAGKDVYLESPVSHSIPEGAALLKAVSSTDRIVQSGMQQRSGAHFQSAVEFVRNGRIGAVHLAKAWTSHLRKPIGIKGEGPVPAGVNYDLWLGPAQERPFHPNRYHYNWRWFWDYGSGELGNWGVHLLDVARWGMNVELPVKVMAAGGKFHFRDDQETPDTLAVNFSYTGKTITWEHRLWTNQGQEGRSAAVAFYGERGTLIVDRSGWKVYGMKDSAVAEPKELTAAHLRDFVDCVKSRRLPAADLATACTSAAMCHLGNLAYRTGRPIAAEPSEGDSAFPESAGAGKFGRTPWSDMMV